MVDIQPCSGGFSTIHFGVLAVTGGFNVAGVKGYWIVLGTTRQIEMYRRPESGRYLEVARVSPEDAIDCGSIPGIRLKIADLFP